MKYAVIDIGSNSVRLMKNEPNKRVNEKILRSTQLAKGMKEGILDCQQIIDTATAVKELFDLAKMEGYEVMIFATEAVRSAKNGNQVTQLIKDFTACDVDVISGDMEATIGFLGACGHSGNKCVLDVGGASSELAAGKDGKLYYSLSLPFGAVRLKDRFGDDVKGLQSFIKEEVKKYQKINCEEYFAISGTATSLSAMIQNMVVYDPNAVHDSFLKTDQLEKLIFNLSNKSADEIYSAYPVIGLKRAEVILCGAVVILEVAKYLNIAGFRVSERDNTEGYLIYKSKSSH